MSGMQAQPSDPVHTSNYRREEREYVRRSHVILFRFACHIFIANNGMHTKIPIATTTLLAVVRTLGLLLSDRQKAK